MRVYIDIDSSEELARYLQDNSWSGARDRIRSLDYDELVSKCEELLSYGIEEISETELNDEIWFGDLFNEEDEEEEEEDEEDEEDEEEEVEEDEEE